MLIQAIGGSQAYGFAHDDSDVDRFGVFVLPTREIVGIRPVKETVTGADPDFSYHEVGKFVKLALKGNPTVIDLLFMDEYETLSLEGQWLVEARSCFLSEPTIRSSYGGYAMSQARKLLKRESEGMVGFGPRTKNRYAKHARHLFRLLEQGRQLLATGELHVRVDNPDELFAVGELPSTELAARFEREMAAYEATPSVLPAEPDYAAVNDLLVQIREANW
jgi:predicted nucleotidyltransferase